MNLSTRPSRACRPVKDNERAELIAALHQSAAMIGGLLDLTDRLIEALESLERPSAEQLDALRVHAWTGGSNSIACGNGWRV